MHGDWVAVGEPRRALNRLFCNASQGVVRLGGKQARGAFLRRCMPTEPRRRRLSDENFSTEPP